MAVVLRAKAQQDGVVVPDGTYRATLSKVSAFANAYGDRVGFEFTLQGPGVEGARVMRSTNTVLSAKSKLAEVLAGLLGRELTGDELSGGLDAERLVGTECRVLVVQARSKSGAAYSNVERVLPAQVRGIQVSG